MRDVFAWRWWRWWRGGGAVVAVSEHGYAHKTAADAVGISDGTLGGWVRLDDGRDDLVADWICEAGLRRIHRWRDKEDHSLLPNN